MTNTPTDTSLHKAQTSPDDELVEEIGYGCTQKQLEYAKGGYANDCLFDDFVSPGEAGFDAGWDACKKSILPLLASREAAVLERAAKVAEQYILDPEKTERDNARNATAKLIGLAIRTLSKGETP